MTAEKETEITEVETGKKMAIIIAIENYKKGSAVIPSVHYAHRDAFRFKDTLIKHLGYLEEEVMMLLDHEAVKATFDNDIPYYIKTLSPDYQFIFYYAGHGFYQDGHNKLTCWDSHAFNLTGTCVSIKDFLLDPLQESGCAQSLIFLDCCSSFLKDGLKSRDVLSDLDDGEFGNFVTPANYHAVFMSCSPGEKSYPDDTLKHGIWTWHLTEALSGNAEGAIVKDIYITDTSLKNYLSYTVPRYITKSTTIRATQNPFAKVHAKNDFLIRKLPRSITAFDKSLPDFRLKYDDAIFRKIDFQKIRNADGFKKGYKIPKWKNSTTINFVQKVFEPDIADEVQKVYEQTKKVCNLKKSDIDYSSSLDGGSVECSLFRYYIEVDLNEDNLAEAKIIRKLQIRVPRSKLPEDFETIFPIYLDELIIPIEGTIDFDDIVNKFENLAEAQGGELSDNEATETLEYITGGGTSITIDIQGMELIITHYSPKRALDLIDKSIGDLKRISSHKIRLLGQ
jgi:hypothetical protein